MAGPLALGGTEAPEGAHTDLLLRVSESYEPADVAGALVCVPVVNVLGVQFHSRYLPDRRDLNRCFPIDSVQRPGSLRDAADRSGVPVLTSEGGQALVVKDDVIAIGVARVLRRSRRPRKRSTRAVTG